MPIDLARARQEADLARFVPGHAGGHYESFFLRANHPSRPLAFWIRYTVFSPAGAPGDAIGELWAIAFDGETSSHAAVKKEVPIARASFDRSSFHAAIDGAELGPGAARGAASSGGHTIAWDLAWEGREPPLFLLPLRLYDAPLPKAKSLVSLPLATFRGAITVDGRPLDVSGWVGSQNHNWGSKHTDRYAWGQVAGFDGHPRTFLEIATARLRFGPLWTPPMTPLVLRHDGDEFALNALPQALRAEGLLQGFVWRFRSETDAVRVEGAIEASPSDFMGLAYRNPPGGVKHCLNSKIATCTLSVLRKTGPRRGRTDLLHADRRAAFEILTDDRDHGIPIRA
jgi:hypothetical protein